MRNITAHDVLTPGTLVRIRPDYHDSLYVKNHVGMVISQEQQELHKLSSMIVDSKFRVLIDDGIHAFYWYELQLDE